MGKSRQTISGRLAGEIINEALNPGVLTGSQRGGGEDEGVSGLLGNYIDSQGGYADSAIAYAVGDGRTADPDAPRGLLPSLGNIPTDMTTLFEAQQAGTTTDFEKSIFDQYEKAFNSTGSGGYEYASEAMGQFDPAGQIAQVGSVNVEDIGTITSEIIGNLPPEFQSFIDRIFTDTSEEAFEAELDNLGNALLAQADQSYETLGGKLKSKFAATTGGTSGSTLEAYKELGIELATNVNAQIAQARLSAIQTLIDEKETAMQTLNVLLDAGEAQRAQDVQGQIAEIDAKARVQSAALAAQASIHQSLIARSTSLEASKLNLLSDTLGQMIAARNADENVRIQGQTQQTVLPWQTMLGLATGSPIQPSNSQGFDIGSVIGGASDIAAAFAMPG